MILARDALAAEMAGEQQRRAAQVAAGQVPTQTYSVGGKSVSHTEWLTTKINDMEKLNALIIQMGGGADNGLYEERTRGYT